MRIEILGAHNTETESARLPCMLVDGKVALDAGGLTSSLSLERQQDIGAVLLTHHHFDHSRDLIMLGANDSLPPSIVDVYGLPETLGVVYQYLLDGKMYRDYTQWPSVDRPRLRLRQIAPFQEFMLDGLTGKAVPVNHSTPAVGYQVTSESGKSIFYTGDTGPGLSGCWEQIRPDILFIEVTGLNSQGETMQRLGHLTPGLLAGELAQFLKTRSYLPRVIVTHIPVSVEEDLRHEVSEAGKQLGMEIEVAYEGLVIEL